MQNFNQATKIHFIITGSIAAYKSMEVLSGLIQSGAQVQTIVTKNAQNFIGCATLEGLTGKPPLVDTFEPGKMMSHIHEERSSEIIVVAPATANFINKIAHGLADDFASTFLLAHGFNKPLLIAPAMNTAMYKHPATQESLLKLKGWGVQVIEPEVGNLACGENGQGRMAEPSQILNKISLLLKASKISSTSSKKILITSGGTQEKIDSVRVITNLSTGRTGVFLAEGLHHMGHQITLLRNKNAERSKILSDQREYTSFSSLDTELNQILKNENFDLVIHAAAVSDYSCVGIEVNSELLNPTSKISSEFETLKVVLKKNIKIVDHIKLMSNNKKLKLIAFKLTDSSDATARQQTSLHLLERSKADLVIQNDAGEAGNPTRQFQVFSLQSAKSTEPQPILNNQNELLSYLTQWVQENL